jgi:hypothetical protein
MDGNTRIWNEKKEKREKRSEDRHVDEKMNQHDTSKRGHFLKRGGVYKNVYKPMNLGFGIWDKRYPELHKKLKRNTRAVLLTWYRPRASSELVGYEVCEDYSELPHSPRVRSEPMSIVCSNVSETKGTMIW